MVVEIAEAEGGSAEVFQAAIDRFTRPIGGAWSVRVF